MELPSYFNSFLSEIRPTANQKADAKTGHQTLRKRLLEDEVLSKIIISTFLQGSYRRATAIRPKGESCFDVDVVVVTTLREQDYTPQQAMDLFVPFLNKHYKDKYKFQGRSIRISLSYVELDLVITSAPSAADEAKLRAASVITDETFEETEDWRLVQSWIPQSQRTSTVAKALMDAAKQEEEWKLSPLRIPDREAEKWDDTHPLEQIRWTWAKNAACNKHYINVVKSSKWWKRENHQTPKYPKGYPLEHLIGQCCPDNILSVASGFTLTLENFVTKFQFYAELEIVPFVPDHGVPEHNVLHRITGAEFSEFYSQVKAAAKIAREALDSDTVYKSATKWRELFGNKFPEPPEEKDSNSNSSNSSASLLVPGFTSRSSGSFGE
jgi:hypothetical protein